MFIPPKLYNIHDFGEKNKNNVKLYNLRDSNLYQLIVNEYGSVEEWIGLKEDIDRIIKEKYNHIEDIEYGENYDFTGANLLASEYGNKDNRKGLEFLKVEDEMSYEEMIFSEIELNRPISFFDYRKNKEIKGLVFSKTKKELKVIIKNELLTITLDDVLYDFIEIK